MNSYETISTSSLDKAKAGDQRVSPAAHTPGPWHTEDETVNSISIKDAAGGYVAEVTTEGDEIIPIMWTYAHMLAAAPDMLAALKVHQLWEKREKEGPLYPFGMSRNSEGGEAIWRAWWEDQLSLCREAWELTDAAIAKAEGR